MPILSRILGVFDWTRDGSAGTGRRMAVLAAMLILGLALAVPVQAAPQLAQSGDAFDRMVAQMEAKHAFYRILFQDHPAERRTFIRALRAAYAKGGRRMMNLMAVRYGVYMGRKYFPYYIARTSDAAVLHYVRFLADTLTLLRIGSPDDCYAFLAGTPRERRRAIRILNAEEKTSMLSMLSEIVVGSRAKGRHAATTRGYERPLQAVLGRVSERIGRDNMIGWKPGLKGDDRAKACDHAVAFFEEILHEPAPGGALVARAVLGH
jgi:hypothetical protein